MCSWFFFNTIIKYLILIINYCLSINVFSLYYLNSHEFTKYCLRCKNDNFFGSATLANERLNVVFYIKWRCNRSRHVALNKRNFKVLDTFHMKCISTTKHNSDITRLILLFRGILRRLFEIEVGIMASSFTIGAGGKSPKSLLHHRHWRRQRTMEMNWQA